VSPRCAHDLQLERNCVEGAAPTASSRRITIMRFQPANLRLINRRRSFLIGYSPCPHEKESTTCTFLFLREFFGTVLAKGPLGRKTRPPLTAPGRSKTSLSKEG